MLHMFCPCMKKGFLVRCNALKLSQNNTGGEDKKTPMLRSRNVVQVSSEARTAMERYLASAFKREIVGYILTLHKMQLDPTNMQYPNVDLLVSKQPAQLA